MARPASPVRRLRRLAVAGLAATLVAGGLVAATVSTPTAVAATAPSCKALSRTVHERVDPARLTSSLTVSSSQSAFARDRGFTEYRERSLRAAVTAGTGLAAVRRLYLARTNDFFYTTRSDEVATLKAAGYVDQGVAFYASKVSSGCLVGVVSYLKAGRHRFVTSAADKAALTAAGWKREATRFYLRTAPVDSTFTIAVMPDTQQEVLRSGDGRMLNRSNWLAANADKLDLRYVSHTGDLVNWDTSDHIQYVRAKAGLKPLRDAKIPMSLSIGNHDTSATCPGGSACDAAATRTLFRRTTTYNSYLGGAGPNQEGAFEPGKVDNTYSVFIAGGYHWLVLNLELWPRQSVVAWAGRVAAAHPKHNVIVVTHSYLTVSGGINTTRGGYGDTTGNYLWTNLIGKYANIRMVFSGHVGTAKHRVDTGVHGNRVDSYLTAIHSDTTNPTRMIAIDTSATTLRTYVYSPWTKKTSTGSGYADTVRNVSWVR